MAAAFSRAGHIEKVMFPWVAKIVWFTAEVGVHSPPHLSLQTEVVGRRVVPPNDSTTFQLESTAVVRSIPVVFVNRVRWEETRPQF